MTAKSVLMRPQGLCHGARAPTCPPVFKAISTRIRIHSFMYLIFLCLLLKKVALLFYPGEARETHPDIFKDFPGLLKFKDFPGQ